MAKTVRIRFVKTHVPNLGDGKFGIPFEKDKEYEVSPESAEYFTERANYAVRVVPGMAPPATTQTNGGTGGGAANPNAGGQVAGGGGDNPAANRGTMPDFESMTVADLSKYAGREKVDLGTATKKADIVAIMVAWWQSGAKPTSTTPPVQ